MDRSVKAEYDKDGDHGDLQMPDARPSYKSWKKKYRKMRIKFDQQMSEIESLHKLEQKAMRTARRLAIENDRIMDLLMDINESPQIPFERRIDLNLDDDEDENDSDATQKPTKSLRKLEQEVPHRSFAASVEQFPELLDDLDPDDPQIHPTSFLTADDIDEYLLELDTRLNLKPKPTLAPSVVGKEVTNPAANFALRNPTSVYNWLRRHAPKTFLQDLEKEKEKDKDKGKDKDDDHHDDEKGGRKRKGGGTARTKRQSAASRKEKERDAAESMDWDEDAGYDAPAAKGKRKRDEDPGYRPKGGSSRPAKKRKSKDLGSLPTKGSRKSAA
ncbi:IEC3 subunit of the Ino80 complex, chromatin re-modelling-domain-containing protein [Hypomontagnella monticulosa]|nr:IEC3 subunit of the Ino80 complex, chromatin re-modelling-domain-containing protein [Hypomontagnella monticulosa]